ncbi:MAG: hypothetical protein GVY36_16300 [Verrucomicrobia bacterium]|nr:hypothetical protein [Verrucomicrobiota bacterium]
MKEWLSALLSLEETTTQVEENTREIEKNRREIEALRGCARKAAKDAERLRDAILHSDDLNNVEFDNLTTTIDSIIPTLEALISILNDGDLKNRIKSLKKGIKRAKTIRANNRASGDSQL